VSDKIRIGVIGTSWWAEAMHLPSLASHPLATVAAITGRNGERAAALGQRFGVPAVFGDYRAMLAESRLDALVVVTPDDLHYEMTLAGLERGLHVLCEKPLGLDTRQAWEMLARAERAGVRHMVGFTWRGLPHYRHLRRLIDSGYLGRCYAAEFSYLTSGGARGSYSWRYDRRRSTGALGNYGAHMIDLAHWLVGDVSRVSAHLRAQVERPGAAGTLDLPANDTAMLALEFAGGAVGTIHVSEVAHVGERLHEQRIRLYGEHGTLEADLTLAGSDLRRGDVRVAAEIRAARRDSPRFEVLPLPADLLAGADAGDLFDPFRTQAVGDRLFIEAIAGERMPPPTFLEGLRVQSVMDAALESARGGRWAAVEKEV
jgi:predicted dehydrogenase